MMFRKHFEASIASCAHIQKLTQESLLLGACFNSNRIVDRGVDP